MPYVNSDGSVTTHPPIVKRVKNFFWGFVDFITIFFRTLINPGSNARGNNYVTDYRQPGSGGPGGPRRPQRKLGGFKTLSDCQAPMAGG